MTTGQAPPHDLAAEDALVTSAMLRPEFAAEFAASVRPDHFYSGTNRAIADAIVHLVNDGKPIDLVTVASRLRDAGKLALVGDAGGLARLANEVPVVTNPAEYARTVRKLAHLRRLLLTCHTTAAQCYAAQLDPDAILAEAEREIMAITADAGAGDGGTTSLRDAGLAVHRTLDSERRGVLTGFSRFDEMTAGLQGGELWYLAARPGMGKTAFALEIALRAASQDVGVLFVSLEMSAEALMSRALSSRARVPLQAIRNRRLSDTQRSRLAFTTSEISDLPIRIFDRCASLREVYAQARRTAGAMKRAKLGLVVCDHIGLVLPNTRKPNREQEVAEISRGLKNLAKTLDVPILALCQVGRDVAKGARRPQLQDMRESGSIEQDADGVIALHRPAYYDLDEPDPEIQREAELLILKQRNGAIGSIPLTWDAEYVAFHEPISA